VKGWLFLIFAAICEAGWFQCIRKMNTLSFEGLLDGSILYVWGDELFAFTWSIGGYVTLGILNAWLFYKALKHVSASVAFSVWTGVALALMVGIDAFIGQQLPDVLQLICLLAILIGVLGLKSGD
jgi:multidrug transporter EmrE-like cation transporter